MKKSIVCLLIVFLLAACTPKEAPVPQLGDLFAKLAMGDSLTAAEIEQLRLEMNKQQGITSQMAALLTPSGNLDPNIFSHHSTVFSTLPHESVSMVRAAASQSIDNETSTVITFEDDATVLGEDAAYSRLLWQSGIDVDRSTGEVFLRGVPEETVWLISYEIVWANPIQAFVGVLEKDTAKGLTHSFDDNDATYLLQTGCFMMQAREAAASWQLTVYHADGAAKNIDFAMFQATRLR